MAPLECPCYNIYDATNFIGIVTMSVDPAKNLVSRRALVLTAVLGALILAGVILFLVFSDDVEPVMLTFATQVDMTNL